MIIITSIFMVAMMLAAASFSEMQKERSIRKSQNAANTSSAQFARK